MLVLYSRARPMILSLNYSFMSLLISRSMPLRLPQLFYANWAIYSPDHI